MITLLLLFALKVVSPGEMACVGSIQEMAVAEDVFIAGVSDEGTTTFGSPGQVLCLNGPGVSLLKTGTVQRVIRPEGRVHDPRTNEKLGTYYKDIGTVRIESVDQESAMARILMTCEGMIKGDIVVPNVARPAIDFSGSLSNALSQLRSGLTGAILLGRHDARQMAVGHFCFIQLGKGEGVKVGDRFVVFRPNPAYNPQDMDSAGSATDALYSPVRGFFGHKLDSMLGNRSLPPKVLGDIVIVEVGEGISTGKIINSMSEIHPGDLVVKQ